MRGFPGGFVIKTLCSQCRGPGFQQNLYTHTHTHTHIYIHTHTYIYTDTHTYTLHGLCWWLSGKEPACNAGDLGSISGSGRSHEGEHGNPLHYSCMENLMDWEAWQATVCRVERVWHNWGTWACVHLYIIYIVYVTYTSYIFIIYKYYISYRYILYNNIYI